MWGNHLTVGLRSLRRDPQRAAIDVDRLIPDRGITEIKIVSRRPAAPAQAN